MATLLETVNPWRLRRRREAESPKKPETRQARRAVTPAVDIAPSDPLIAYFLSAPGPTELDKLHLDSPALK